MSTKFNSLTPPICVGYNGVEAICSGRRGHNSTAIVEEKKKKADKEKKKTEENASAPSFPAAP